MRRVAEDPMSQLRTRLTALAARFAEDRSGVVAIIFGLSILPLILSVGVAMDYGRRGTTESKLQGAADTAALALAHEADTLQNDALSAMAKKIVQANFGMVQGAELLDVQAVKGDGKVTVTAKAAMPTSFAGVMNIDKLPVSVSASSVWGGNPIELALVLDNTGSMDDDDKLETMQTAVHNMLNTLENPTAIAQGAIKIGIVPFTTQVKVSPSHKSADWVLDFKERSEMYSAQGNFLAALYWGLMANSTWAGCLSDRAQPYDVDDTAPTTNQTRYWAELSCKDSTLEQLLPLTDNFSGLRTKVDAMKAKGSTNITIGIAWGMAMLSSQVPLTEASAVGAVPGMKKIMIVLTDGLNTSGTTDARTELACQNAKNMGIEVFTIRVVEGNKDLLGKCASSASHYFNVENVDDLLPAFEAITSHISELRIAS